MHRSGLMIEKSRINLFNQQTKFEDDYLTRTYSKITNRSDLALTELVANAWDSGASKVEITIPELKRFEDIYIKIEDDGSGMTKEEFNARWMTLAYNRLRHQGEYADMPPERAEIRRRAYGRNGVGRHSMLCFSNRYSVETWKNDLASRFELEQSGGQTALRIINEKIFKKVGHGTIISARLDRNYPEINKIKQILSARFMFDPQFQLFINGERIELDQHTGLIIEKDIKVIDGITVKITALSSKSTARKSQQHGVAFWVNKRLVGEPSWNLNKKNLADGRTTIARQFTIIVQTDDMLSDITEDWTSFKNNSRVDAVFNTVEQFTNELFREVNKDKNEDLKKTIVRKYADDFASIDLSFRRKLLELVDQAVDESPELSRNYLDMTIGKLLEINKSSSKKMLLEKIFSLTDQDADKLNRILEDWNVSDIECVLDEIDRRIATVQAIEKFSKIKGIDELHVLHPLVLEAKWIFGAEFDSAFYVSNSWLSTILKKHLKKPEKVENLTNPRKRADIVLFDDGSMIGYATDEYNSAINLVETKKLLIIELKCGDSEIGTKEVQQAEEYVNELYFANAFNSKIQINSFVVGYHVSDRMSQSKVLKDIDDSSFGYIRATTYYQLVSTAEARLLGLKKQLIERYEKIEPNDLLKRALSSDTAQLAIDFAEKI